MIRACTEADIPFVMDLGKRFADEAGVTAQVGWDDATVESLLRLMIAEHILLRGERSILGGLVFPHPFSGRKVFQEMFWRSEGHEGVKLLAAAEQQARAMGAERAMMLFLDALPGAERIYQRRGYARAETSYIKEL